MATKVGLVLAGGGGKGAYQVGVMKALVEFGLDRAIQVVAGTSIGAINAAFFLQGDLSAAEAIWLNATPTQALGTDILQRLNLFQLDNLATLHRDVLLNQIRSGIFSQEGLSALIDQHLDLARVAAAPVEAYTTCYSGWPLGSVTYFSLAGAPPERIKRILMASAAVPILYGGVEIDGQRYSDGGLGVGSDNVPVKPVYEAGCDVIFVVHLDKDELINPAAYPNATLFQIVPTENLGSLISGNLDFHGENARWRMEVGYRDATRLFQAIGAAALAMARGQQQVAEVAAAAAATAAASPPLPARLGEVLQRTLARLFPPAPPQKDDDRRTG